MDFEPTFPNMTKNSCLPEASAKTWIKKKKKRYLWIHGPPMFTKLLTLGVIINNDNNMQFKEDMNWSSQGHGI